MRGKLIKLAWLHSGALLTCLVALVASIRSQADLDRLRSMAREKAGRESQAFANEFFKEDRYGGGGIDWYPQLEDVSNLPDWQERLLTDPSWNLPYIAPQSDTPPTTDGENQED